MLGLMVQYLYSCTIHVREGRVLPLCRFYFFFPERIIIQIFVGYLLSKEYHCSRNNNLSNGCKLFGVPFDLTKLFINIHPKERDITMALTEPKPGCNILFPRQNRLHLSYLKTNSSDLFNDKYSRISAHKFRLCYLTWSRALGY